MKTHLFSTTGTTREVNNLRIVRSIQRVEGPIELARLASAIDNHRGLLLSSGFEFPGRYARWDIGFCHPPLSLEGRGLHFALIAHNPRGEVLLTFLHSRLCNCAEIKSCDVQQGRMDLLLHAPSLDLCEELRTKRPSAMSVVRALCDAFAVPDDPHLGLYGAFGYDLVFALDDLEMRMPREDHQRDVVLFLPDDILVIDRQSGIAHRVTYEFEYEGSSTQGMPRTTGEEAFAYEPSARVSRDHAPGEFAQVVRLAHEHFARGDLFEVTPSQVFRTPIQDLPSQLFLRLCEQNPAPYGFFMNLGQQEYLVGASPEMYVRVQGRRVETCPIAGTIARGSDALDDALQIRKLLESEKEESELTMCTDVDRNDKARICEPGSVRVLGRRQIEMYSRLIHTVDHVEGMLREGYDTLDAFMTHLWAVTVTGAPKLAAMQFIEDHEKSPRRFYGGAVGYVGFNGSLNTGIAIRTIRINHGIAEVRAGATLLFDCVPEQEEAETELKASALLSVLGSDSSQPTRAVVAQARPGEAKRVLLVDHQDSFVHTLADYFRQTGAEVTTVRYSAAMQRLASHMPDLCVLSPGPGRPADFGMSAMLAYLVTQRVPTFGVCLGLQGMVEFFGGQLSQLSIPAHGRASVVRVVAGGLFAGLPPMFRVGRYHSLYADASALPTGFSVTALLDQDDDPGAREVDRNPRPVMALEHLELPLAAVQFHPESILSLYQEHGLRLVHNVMEHLI